MSAEMKPIQKKVMILKKLIENLVGIVLIILGFIAIIDGISHLELMPILIGLCVIWGCILVYSTNFFGFGSDLKLKKILIKCGYLLLVMVVLYLGVCVFQPYMIKIMAGV